MSEYSKQAQDIINTFARVKLNRDEPEHLPYAEQLKDPRWLQKRIHILQRDNYKCQICGVKSKSKSGKSPLHVHHMKYYRKAWDAKDEWLISLCKSCHKSEEALLKEDPSLISTSRELLIPATLINKIISELLQAMACRKSTFIDAFSYVEAYRHSAPPTSQINTTDEFVQAGLGGRVKRNPHFLTDNKEVIHIPAKAHVFPSYGTKEQMDQIRPINRDLRSDSPFRKIKIGFEEWTRNELTGEMERKQI